MDKKVHPAILEFLENTEQTYYLGLIHIPTGLYVTYNGLSERVRDASVSDTNQYGSDVVSLIQIFGETNEWVRTQHTKDFKIFVKG